MLIYEVNLSVEPEARDAFESWLGPHIDEIIAIDGFTGATLYERNAEDEGGDASDARTHWTVHYACATREQLDAYFRDHAPRLRQDGLDRFNGQFTATRRVLRVVRAS